MICVKTLTEHYKKYSTYPRFSLGHNHLSATAILLRENHFSRSRGHGYPDNDNMLKKQPAIKVCWFGYRHSTPHGTRWKSANLSQGRLLNALMCTWHDNKLPHSNIAWKAFATYLKMNGTLEYVMTFHITIHQFKQVEENPFKKRN